MNTRLTLILLILSVAVRAEVTLTWDDNSTDERGFEIERALGQTGAFAPIGQVAANVKTFVDTTTAPATNYRYRVAAWNDAGKSAWSNIVTHTTRAATPKAPSNAGATDGPAYTPPKLTLSAGESVMVSSRLALNTPKAPKGKAKAKTDLPEIILPTGDELQIVAIP